MVVEDDEYVIDGAEAWKPLIRTSLGRLVYNTLLTCGSDEVAMVDVITKETISYQTLLELSCSLAESLHKHGYDKKTNFAISSENNLRFFVPIFSSFFIGATILPINHTYTNREFEHTLNITKPNVVFVSKAISKKFLELQNQLPYIKRIIVIDSDDRVVGCDTLNGFIGGIRLKRFNLVEVNPDDDVALVMCSSGTTGLPKGVMQTHTNLVVRYMHTTDPRYVLQTPIGSSCLGLLPFFHGFGLTTSFFAMIKRQKIVVMKRFEEKVFLKTIEDYRIRILWLAPPLVIFLAKSPLVMNYDLSSLQDLASGAAPLSKKTEEMVKKRLNITGIRQGYGLTEATFAVMMLRVNEQRPGSSGRIISFMKCKVRDPETGRSLGAGQVGELCFKGPLVMKGYYGNVEATQKSFTSDGWLLTGDLGYYDHEEYFYIVDRLKELIKYKGYQVAPAELEAVLLTNPKIKDAGVVGLPNEECGELPVAFVVKTPGENLTEKEVENYVQERVSSQKRLRGGVIFLNEIPKTPSGKILRKDLRQLLKEYQSKL